MKILTGFFIPFSMMTISLIASKNEKQPAVEVKDDFTYFVEQFDDMRFLKYAKRVFFANGIHHHYSSDKLKPLSR